MKIIHFTSLLVMSFLITSCSHPDRELATSAVAEDFNGQWSGPWNWSPYNTASVEISGREAKVAGFPVQTASGGSTVLASEGDASFQREYGSEGAPCVLLHTQSNVVTAPLFITKDKKHLIYDVDINYDKQIVFTKKSDAKSR